MSRRLNVLAIPSGTPLLETFVAAFRSGDLFGRGPLTPLEIAGACIFVPTRRAGAALTAELARTSGATATLLPTILPLGDPDALDEIFDAGFDGTASALPVIGDLDRRLVLFRLIDAWREAIGAARDARGEREPFHVGRTRADAFALSGDLAKLIEETIIEGVPLTRLAGGLPEDYRPERHSQYWQLTETFLKIAAAYYPAELDALGRRDPAEALTARLSAFAQRMAEGQPARPVVVLGSTGSVSATAELMAVVARLPLGAVVLPGLDMTDAAAAFWPLIGAEDADLPTRYAHPQVMLKRTLARIGLAREDVLRLPRGALPNARERLVSEVFHPAALTDLWHRTTLTGETLRQAVDGITLIEAADEREEALAIALLFRETLETEAKTAALVTPDRALARAVQAELSRWDITVADSAGELLANTAAASLARLLLRAVADDAGGVELLAVLRHPRACLGLEEGERNLLVDAIEIAAMRGKRLRGGAAGLPDAVRVAIAEKLSRHAPQPRSRVAPEALERALQHTEYLAAAIARLQSQGASASTLRAWAAAHRICLETLLASGPDSPGTLDGDDGLALAALFDEIATAGSAGPDIALADYTLMFDTLLAGRVVRPRQPGHPRLKIWGLLEARLLEADRLILGGLDEGIWPPEARGDPFLNRPMRIALGLQPPERRIGQTAHDFMMLLGGNTVVLTRARKRGGSPAIASRFLRRLTAFVGDEAVSLMAKPGLNVLRWARALDTPEHEPRPVARPSPHPPAALTPERLSLTEIETLYRDPYVIFARHILKLDSLEPVDPPLNARERGTIVHEALSRFTKRHPEGLPADAEAELLRFGAAAFADVRGQDPEAVQFWLRRFEAFVPWFVAWDRERRKLLSVLHSEVPGRLDVTIPGSGGRVLTLATRADRIEHLKGGGLAIIDYKTGQPPGTQEVLRGLAPQLPLTAALVARGAFAGIDGHGMKAGAELSYLHVAMANGMGKERWIEPGKRAKAEGTAMADIIEQQFAELENYLGKLVSGAVGYTAHRIPKKVSYRSDYDHLARVAEWSLGGGDETMDGGE